MSFCTRAMISGMCSVALGWTVARRTPRASTSWKYSAMKRSPRALTVVPSSLARLIILSSMSVKFCTNVTS